MISVRTKKTTAFHLSTAHTSYLFRITETGHPEHLYYGKRLPDAQFADEEDIAMFYEKRVFAPGNTSIYDADHPDLSLENICLEMSSRGKGDLREPFLTLVHSDGSVTSDFRYQEYEITPLHLAAPISEELPYAYDELQEAERLCVRLYDASYGIKLELYYTVFPDCDVITRSAKCINASQDAITIDKMMSLQLDLSDSDYVFTNFTGAWAREMQRQTLPLLHGRLVNSSSTGTSSNRANPFVMLGRESTAETYGECIGVNLVYSGNHYESVEVNAFGKTRLLAGINPESFTWNLAAGESFASPEAVLCYSDAGYNGLSVRLHGFIREHIVRGTWKKKERPILLNSWEACYFDISQSKLLRLAKEGKDAGIELFVMDDGWFGERNDDTSSLGDWEPNTKKLPGGISELSQKITELGMQFGIWVEPEMVSTNSKLYLAHPEWCIRIPEKPHSEGRNQRILDLTNPAVQDYIIEAMTKVFSSGEISYVKWDMNRNFTDLFSQQLDARHQGEVAHRYVLGLYRIMKTLTERFPHILFEGCSAGGNRFDLGILCYFPQIWASDNTDTHCRSEIQHNYSYGYPQSTYSAHVSASPNHQTLRKTPLESRFATAAFGILGYECNFGDLSNEEKKQIKEEISTYQKWRSVLQFGQLYRGEIPGSRTFANCAEMVGTDRPRSWTCVSEDQTQAVGYYYHGLSAANTVQHSVFKPVGLDGNLRYHFYNRALKINIKDFGDLVNAASPVHIRNGSLMQDMLSRFITLDGESEDYEVYGETLMNAGVALKQAFGATGFNKAVRVIPDFSARLYFMEETNPSRETL